MARLPNINCFRVVIRWNDAEASVGLRYSSAIDKLSLSVSEGCFDFWKEACVEDRL